MKSIFLMIISCIVLQYFSCVSLVSGTTDTGNAKISAEIYTNDGKRASGAEVVVLPAEYLYDCDSCGTGADSSENMLIMTTDDSGFFRIDSLKSGEYTIEVNDGNSAVMIKISIPVEQDSIIIINDTLKSYGAVKGSIGSVEDTTLRRYLLIYGLKRRVEISSDGKFIIEDLPPGTFNLKIAANESGYWEPIEIDNVIAISKDTVPVPFAGWKHRAQVILNTTESGANVIDNVYGFPVLITLSNLNFNFSEAQEDGNDCVFYKNDSTAIPFQIELWDASQELAYIWVRIDTVYGNNKDQSFTMLWGNSNADFLIKPSDVFDTTDGFIGCYHFNDNVCDATINDYDGTDSGTLDTDGIVGCARKFDGSGFINLGDLPDRPEGTISCWLNPAYTINQYTGVTQGIWGKFETDILNFTLSFQGSDFYAGVGSAGKLITKQEDSTAGYYLASSTISFNENKWYHAVWSWGDEGGFLYVNGKLECSSLDYRPVRGDGNDEIGRSYYDSLSNIVGGGPLYFTGILDEFRINKVQRSESWIKLCYMNQLSGNLVAELKKEF